jgi:hypothetical protein
MKFLALLLVARYSGSMRPACRINHTGILSVGSPFAALRTKSFSNIVGANLHINIIMKGLFIRRAELAF